MTSVALFPGQGVHGPGMAEGLPERAPDVFEAASSVLGVDVVELCAAGRSGDADLASTRWAQPAVLVAGVASFLAMRDEDVHADVLVGHSVGEYTALVCAGSLSVEDAVELLEVRGAAMEDASAQAPGGMGAVLRLGPDEVRRVAREADVDLAGDNAPGQLVVAGPDDRLEQARELVEAAGGRWASLDVAGPFHSRTMAAAAPALRAALDGVRVRPPELPVWSPTTVRPFEDPDGIRDALEAQLTSPVRFRETIEALAEQGTETFWDAGPGRIVGGMARRSARGAEVRYASEVLGELSAAGRKS